MEKITSFLSDRCCEYKEIVDKNPAGHRWNSLLAASILITSMNHPPWNLPFECGKGDTTHLPSKVRQHAFEKKGFAQYFLHQI